MKVDTLSLEEATRVVDAAVGFTTQSSAQMNGQYALGVDTLAYIMGGSEKSFAFNAVISSGTPLVADSRGARAMVAMAVTYQYAVPMTTIVNAIRSIPLEKKACPK
jgi:hypothetical protein